MRSMYVLALTLMTCRCVLQGKLIFKNRLWIKIVDVIDSFCFENNDLVFQQQVTEIVDNIVRERICLH